MTKRRMRFGTWCKKDLSDTRKIVYELRTYDGGTLHFTSDDPQPPSMLYRLRYAWIDSIESVKNEQSDYWLAKLYED